MKCTCKCTYTKQTQLEHHNHSTCAHASSVSFLLDGVFIF